MGSRAVRCRILFVAPSPSRTTRLSIGATWAVAGTHSANKSETIRTATLRRHYGTGQSLLHVSEVLPSQRRMSYPSVMWMRAGCWVAAMSWVPLLCAAAPPPASWVPVRWPWADTRSLELLAGTPVNCLLLKSPTPQLVAAVQARGVVALALVAPGGDGHEVERAQAAKVDGIVLEGEFPEGTAAGIKDLAVIELASRSRLQLGSAAPVIGTYQGVWPGIGVDDEGAKKSGPTSGVWIDTNTGFLRAVRAWGNATVWIANQPPPKTAVAATRYLQVIADAGISGARWVVAFDDDLAVRLAAREEAAMGTWT